MATWEYSTLHYLTPDAASPQGLRLPTVTLLRLAAVFSLVLTLLSTPYWAGRIFLRIGLVTAPPRISESTRPNSAISTRPRATSTRTMAAPRGQQARRASRARGFVVSFGSFSRRPVAEAQARTIRSKGYHAAVTQVGRSYHVVGHAYQDRMDAEFWAKVFGGIGLHTRVYPLNSSNLSHAIETYPLPI